MHSSLENLSTQTASFEPAPHKRYRLLLESFKQERCRKTQEAQPLYKEQPPSTKIVYSTANESLLLHDAQRGKATLTLRVSRFEYMKLRNVRTTSASPEHQRMWIPVGEPPTQIFLNAEDLYNRLVDHYKIIPSKHDRIQRLKLLKNFEKQAQHTKLTSIAFSSADAISGNPGPYKLKCTVEMDAIGGLRIVEKEVIGKGSFKKVFREKILAHSDNCSYPQREIARGKLHQSSQIDWLLSEAKASELLFKAHISNILFSQAAPSQNPLKRRLDMPLLQGGNLTELIEKDSELFPPQQRLRCLQIVATTLSEMHAAGFIHSDVKLENVLYDPKSNSFLLADLGHVTQIGQMCIGGTFSPPEVTQNALIQKQPTVATEKIDCWAFGIFAYAITRGPSAYDKAALTTTTSASDYGLSLTQLAAFDIVKDLSLNNPIDLLALQLLSSNPEQRPAMSKIAQELYTIQVTPSS